MCQGILVDNYWLQNGHIMNMRRKRLRYATHLYYAHFIIAHCSHVAMYYIISPFSGMRLAHCSECQNL